MRKNADGEAEPGTKRAASVARLPVHVGALRVGAAVGAAVVAAVAVRLAWDVRPRGLVEPVGKGEVEQPVRLPELPAGSAEPPMV